MCESQGSDGIKEGIPVFIIGSLVSETHEGLFKVLEPKKSKVHLALLGRIKRIQCESLKVAKWILYIYKDGPSIHKLYF